MLGLVDMSDPSNPKHVKLPDDDTNEYRLRNGKKLSNTWLNDRLEFHATNFTMHGWLARKLKSLRKIKTGAWKKDRMFDVNDSMYQDPQGNKYSLDMTESEYQQLVAEWMFVSNVSNIIRILLGRMILLYQQ